MASVSHFMFGNSLVNYAEGGAETNILVWLDDMAEWAGHDYAGGGGYGFLRDFADRAEPLNQWGFAGVIPAYDGQSQSFAGATIDTVTITPANFIQYQSWDAAYPGDSRSPLDATLDLVADIRADQPDAQILIYEGWSDMAGITAWPADAEGLAAYHAYNTGAYHDWFTGYVDAINAADPGADVTLLPIGSTLSRILTETPARDIPADELYVDDAPHGTETIYFLAAAITYPALYGEPLPADYPVPEGIHPLVAGNMDAINGIIGEELAEAGFALDGAPLDETPEVPDTDVEPEPGDPVIEPDPIPDPAPQPEPDPVEEPEPLPTPDPLPEPEPEPVTDPAPEPQEPEQPEEAENTAPAPEPDRFVVTGEGPSFRLEVMANDGDSDGDALRLFFIEPGEFGRFEMDGDRILYTPNADFEGEDSFLYFVTDDRGGIIGTEVVIERILPDLPPAAPEAPEEEVIEEVAEEEPETAPVDDVLPEEVADAPVTDAPTDAPQDTPVDTPDETSEAPEEEAAAPDLPEEEAEAPMPEWPADWPQDCTAEEMAAYFASLASGGWQALETPEPKTEGEAMLAALFNAPADEEKPGQKAEDACEEDAALI